MTSRLNHLGQPIGQPVEGWTPPHRPPREAIVGARVRLEPLDPTAHADALWEADQRDADRRSWTYLPYGPFDRADDHRVWMSEAAASSDPLFFAVVDRSTRAAVGVASYLRMMPEAGSIEVGHINFSPVLQRTCGATEAMYLMMRSAFELGYRRYEWKCDALNQPSRMAAARLGLSFEGVFRQATVYKGRNRDTAWYAAIDGEWPRLRAAFEQWLAPSNFDAQGHQRLRLSDLTRPILVNRG